MFEYFAKRVGFGWEVWKRYKNGAAGPYGVREWQVLPQRFLRWKTAADVALTCNLSRSEAVEAEAKLERAREALARLDNIVDQCVKRTDAPHRMKGSDGKWHAGPTVDETIRVLDAVQRFSRAALDTINGDDNA